MSSREDLSAEQIRIVDRFQAGFAAFRQRDIVLYGIGRNTEAIVKEQKGFKIRGLMDSRTTGEEIYGLKVLGMDEVIRMRPIIVIIARDSVVDIIYARIEKLKLEYNIPIYDYKGQELGKEETIFDNSNLEYWDRSEEELRIEIDNHDIISFDIFDTLIMRYVLEPEDIFDIVETKIRSRIRKFPFKKMRIKAEKCCEGIPNIHDIYQSMGEMYTLDNSIISLCKELEFTTEQKFITARHKMVEIYHYALEKHKKVYLLSDMYYPMEMMEQLLNHVKIKGYHGLLISCDKQKEKRDGTLFEDLLKAVESRNILHIGDNRRADIIEAQKAGIDAYHIYSALEVLIASDMKQLTVHMDTFERRSILGLFAAYFFNDPFILNERKGKLEIASLKDLGRCFIAPMLVEFVQWMIHREEKTEKALLFPSRDGYLLKQIYDLFAQFRKLPKSIYFKTSRRAVTTASINNEEDIIHIVKRPFSGRVGELLTKRFGLKIDNEDNSRINVSELEEEERITTVLKYKKSIFTHAQLERQCYMRYLEELGIHKGQEYRLFDFVAGGTVQYYLSRLLETKLKGVYFATMNLPNHMFDRNKDIDAAYGNFTSYDAQSNLAKYYLVMECILTDKDAVLLYVSKEGKLVFDSVCNDKYERIKNVHKGILEYAKLYLDLYAGLHSWTAQLGVADEIYGYLFKHSTFVSSDIKQCFVNDDQYDGVDSAMVWPG